MHSAADVQFRGARTAQIGQLATGVVILGGVVALFHDVAGAMVETWYESNSFNHGFLIVPICLWLGWRRRATLAATEVRPNLWGAVGVALACFGWLLGSATGTLVIQELCLVTIIQGIVLTMYGWQVCRVLIFPLLYLFFAVPFGEGLVGPLQSITAALSVWLLRISAIPVFADGNIISVPSGTFYVAEACSGIRYLISSLVLGVLFAGLTYHAWWRRAVFLAISLIIPVVANGIRAFGIIVVAYTTTNEVAVGIDHLIYGWIFFTLVTFVVLAVGVSFREHDIERAPPPAPRPVLVSSVSQLLAVGIIALSPAAGAKLYALHMEQRSQNSVVRLHAPGVDPSWHELTQTKDAAPPIFAAPDQELHIGYERNGARVFLHIGYYGYGRRGAQAVSSAHKLIGPEWMTAAAGNASALIDGQPVRVQAIRSTHGRQGHITWSWYWVDGRFTGNPYAAKILEAKAKLLGGAQSAAIIVLDTDYDDDSRSGERLLESFAAGMHALARGLGGER